MKCSLFLLLLLASCSNPFQSPGSLNFKTKQFKIDPLREAERLRLLREAELERRRLFLIEKEQAWSKIVIDANDGFMTIEATIKTKCFACHDANTKTPIYGRILRSVNPIYRHQKEGIEALDFSQKFPLVAKGKPSQIALLNAIKNEVLDRSMPLKIYTNVYRNRKINDSDEEKILAWVNPLIDTIEEFEERFKETEINLDTLVHKILDQKCFRCHANGNDKGGFENMQDTKALLKSRHVNLTNPSESEIYKLSLEKNMPPNRRDALSDEELLTLNEWLEVQARETPPNP